MMKETVEKIIRGGGEILMRHFGTTTDGWDKKWKGDAESHADLETEAFLAQGLRMAFPGDAIMTEEHPAFVSPTNGRLWIVDALDGSRNFIRSIPLFGISIALVDHDALVFGMVYLPFSKELFFATRGSGAFCNEKKIIVGQTHDLDGAVIMFMPSYNRLHNPDVVRIGSRLHAEKIWQFNPGYIVMPLCYTAAGRHEGSITMGVHVWDVAASVLIVEEAGGKVTHVDGSPWHWKTDPQSVIAANPVLHEKIMQKIIL